MWFGVCVKDAYMRIIYFYILLSMHWNLQTSKVYQNATNLFDCVDLECDSSLQAKGMLFIGV